MRGVGEMALIGAVRGAVGLKRSRQPPEHFLSRQVEHALDAVAQHINHSMGGSVMGNPNNPNDPNKTNPANPQSTDPSRDDERQPGRQQDQQNPGQKQPGNDQPRQPQQR